MKLRAFQPFFGTEASLQNVFTILATAVGIFAAIAIALNAYSIAFFLGASCLVLAFLAYQAHPPEQQSLLQSALQSDDLRVRPLLVMRPEEVIRAVWGNDRTEVQAKKLSELYLGKRIKISGSVNDVVAMGRDRLSLSLQLDVNTRSKYFSTYVNWFANARSEDPAWIDQVHTLPKRTHVTITGSIEHIYSSGLSLEDCIFNEIISSEEHLEREFRKQIEG